MAIRVLIADDHEILRSGLRAIFEGTDIKVVAEASSGKDALRLVGEKGVDVVILDYGKTESAPMYGTRVSPITTEKLNDELMLREALECQVARLAARVSLETEAPGWTMVMAEAATASVTIAA